MHESWGNPWHRSIWHKHNALLDPFWHSDLDELIEWHSLFPRSLETQGWGNPLCRQYDSGGGSRYNTNDRTHPQSGVNRAENLCSSNVAPTDTHSTQQHQNPSVNDPHRGRRQPDTMPTANLQQRPVTFAELDVSGYRSDELDIWVEGQKIIVKGHHKCDCDDTCLVREFQRTYGIPQNLDSKSVKAKYGRDRKLVLQGNVARNHQQFRDDRQVEIDYQGPKETPREQVQCQQKKAGIPLKKVKVPRHNLHKNTITAPEHIDKSFEGEIADDGVTIEVVE